MKLAGFDTNPVLFSKKHVADDGHQCDSFSEKVIDDWLTSNGIAHTRTFRYGNTKLTADFQLGPNHILEFFGLAGMQSKYDSLITRKRKLCNDLGLKLIEIYPEDIYPNNRLRILLNSFL